MAERSSLRTTINFSGVPLPLEVPACHELDLGVCACPWGSGTFCCGCGYELAKDKALVFTLVLWVLVAPEGWLPFPAVMAGVGIFCL